MQKTMNFKKLCSLCLCFVLIAAIALFTTACTKNDNVTEGNISDGNTAVIEMLSMGQGEKSFTFCVSDAEGKETWFDINTDKTAVGEALVELGLVDGEEGPYGLYVKTVNGLTLDYDKDGMYWAFYVGEELSPLGVDMTEITDGEVYRFVAAEG